MAKILFHTQDQQTRPIPGALLQGLSAEHGDWQALTDTEGNFTAGLAPGAYTGIVSAPGFATRTYEGPNVWRFQDDGSVYIGLDPAIVPPIPPDPPIPPVVGDMINIHEATIVNSPDVRGWNITTEIESVGIYPGGPVGNTIVEFTKHHGAGKWPMVVPPGWEGGLQYTVWLFLQLTPGVWTGAGFIQCWEDRNGCGDSISDYPINWYYPSRWNPMTGHVIQPGEEIAYMVTAGNARDGGQVTLQERSNIVVIPAPMNDNGIFYFHPTE